MPSPFHSGDERLGFRENHRCAFVSAGEFFYSLLGIESQQGNELHFIAVLANKQFRAAISGDVSRGDAPKISLRNMFSYAFASAGFVQPCQIRAIIHIPMIW
jgi:hypothetical protein